MFGDMWAAGFRVLFWIVVIVAILALTGAFLLGKSLGA